SRSRRSMTRFFSGSSSSPSGRTRPNAIYVLNIMDINLSNIVHMSMRKSWRARLILTSSSAPSERSNLTLIGTFLLLLLLFFFLPPLYLFLLLPLLWLPPPRLLPLPPLLPYLLSLLTTFSIIMGCEIDCVISLLSSLTSSPASSPLLPHIFQYQHG